jgi:hypothetical protein
MSRRETFMRSVRALSISAGLLAGLGSAGAALSAPHLDLRRLSPSYAETAELKDAGLARTAVERRFSRSEASAALGFLCGRQPSAVTSGGAAAYGVDPHGRFLGAQLRFSFR